MKKGSIGADVRLKTANFNYNRSQNIQTEDRIGISPPQGFSGKPLDAHQIVVTARYPQ